MGPLHVVLGGPGLALRHDPNVVGRTQADELSHPSRRVALPCGGARIIGLTVVVVGLAVELRIVLQVLTP